MNRVLRLVLVCLLTAVVVLSSCTQNVPEPPAQSEPEATETAPPTTPIAPPSAPPDTSTPSSPPPSSPKPSGTPPPPKPPQTRPLSPLDDFKKGMHFADWNPYDEPKYGFYMPPGTDQSLINLAATGANWISLVVTRTQETIASTKISYDSPRTAEDSELRRVIELAHSLGMRVMLWPGLGLSDDPDHWWGQIGTAFTSEAQWQEWFASYRESINHYAAFAQEAGADMLSIGIELGGTTHREEDWRRVIQEVRERFKGPITYSSLSSSAGASTTFPHGEEKRIKWWDAVDYIGVSAYYNLTDKNAPTVEDLKKAWTEMGHIALLESLSTQFDKPILFTEIGYESAEGANKWPGWMGRGAPLDLQEQADCYQATLEVLWDKPWFAGIFWWQWFAETKTGGPSDTSSTPWGKPAEEVLKRFYLEE